MRARWVTSIDVRTQTEYGTLRAYSRAGFQTTTGETTQGKIYTERGFIQFAGFTFGKSQSYFDFFGGAFCYGCFYTGSLVDRPVSAGTLLAAYTATFGNGFTATISLEDQFMRRNAIWDASNDATNALVIGNMPGPGAAQDSYNVAAINFGDMAATGIPDIVGALRVEQAWGSAQIAGALHQLRAGYYGNNTTGAGANVLGVNNRFLAPNDAYGWAAMAGIVINLPWAKGDRFYVEATFCEGAGAYCRFGRRHRRQEQQLRPFQRRERDAAPGRWTRSSARWSRPTARPVSSSPGSSRSTVPSSTTGLRRCARRLWGNYTAADYNDIATTIFCSSPQSPVRRLAAPNTPLTGATVVAGCNPDFDQLGGRHADDLEPGTAVRYRPRSVLHEESRRSSTRARWCSTSRARAAVRRASTSRRATACGARSSACSVTSGHDRLIIAGSPKEPPAARPGVFRLPTSAKAGRHLGEHREALSRRFGQRLVPIASTPRRTQN